MVHLDSTHIAMITTIGGKLVIEIADALPPPPESCGFWCRWCYDFIQGLSSNSSKIGATKEKSPGAAVFESVPPEIKAEPDKARAAAV